MLLGLIVGMFTGVTCLQIGYCCLCLCFIGFRVVDLLFR